MHCIPDYATMSLYSLPGKNLHSDHRKLKGSTLDTWQSHQNIALIVAGDVDKPIHEQSELSTYQNQELFWTFPDTDFVKLTNAAYKY